VKTGRTHLQDAAPLTLGQEISAWLEQIHFAEVVLAQKSEYLLPLAIGGTAVGTGLNAHPELGAKVAKHIRDLTGIPFGSADNKFFALSAHDPLVEFSASLRTLAVALIKIANDIRWLASGPRSGSAPRSRRH
jgi:fumarate hydratase class II